MLEDETGVSGSECLVLVTSLISFTHFAFPVAGRLSLSIVFCVSSIRMWCEVLGLINMEIVCGNLVLWGMRVSICLVARCTDCLF